MRGTAEAYASVPLLKVSAMRGVFGARLVLQAGLAASFFIVVGTTNARAQAVGALAGGWSAETIAHGGAAVAAQGAPLDAVEFNPAGLAALEKRELDLSGVGALGLGSFQNTVDAHGRLSGNTGAIGYGALGLRLGRSAWRAGIAATPEQLVQVNWRYLDPPGTAGVSYGLQKNESKILALRTSAELARTLGPHWAVGGSLGLVYNTNTLIAPFIFQQQPELAGLKVLLNLQTAGFGWNGSSGVQWQPNSRFRFGAAWKSAAAIQSHGTARGTASALFAALGVGADPRFTYRAEVDNRLPQSFAGGGEWQVRPQLRVSLQGDWIDWGGAFRQLPVKLAGGTNPVINSVAGSSSLRDEVPLGWHSQGGLRTGAEHPIGEHWAVRGGYSFQSDPVPSATLTPLTAAVFQNAIGAGAGWKHGRMIVDAAYQAQLPRSREVGTSSLRAGEYNDTKLSVAMQSVTVTTRLAF